MWLQWVALGSGEERDDVGRRGNEGGCWWQMSSLECLFSRVLRVLCTVFEQISRCTSLRRSCLGAAIGFTSVVFSRSLV